MKYAVELVPGFASDQHISTAVARILRIRTRSYFRFCMFGLDVAFIVGAVADLVLDTVQFPHTGDRCNSVTD
jgi:hypothetical protein